MFGTIFLRGVLTGVGGIPSDMTVELLGKLWFCEEVNEGLEDEVA